MRPGSPPDANVLRLLRRRRRLTVVVAAALGFLAAAAILDRAGLLARWGLLRPAEPHVDAGDRAAFDGKSFIVRQVLDGDTLDVAPAEGGPATRVRLLGIDAAEMRHGSDDGPDHWAGEAADWLRTVTAGKAVVLKLDPPRTRDRYERLLAYVYLSDDLNVNLEMVRLGHAYADWRFGHSFEAQFGQAEALARRRKLGLWEGVTRERMPPWRRGASTEPPDGR
jgi:micrococcal nuclease